MGEHCKDCPYSQAGKRGFHRIWKWYKNDVTMNMKTIWWSLGPGPGSRAPKCANDMRRIWKKYETNVEEIFKDISFDNILLKVDIEGSEYEIIDQIINS